MGLETLGGPVFICWRGGKPPKDKKVKCSVCKTRWSTLLCDGAIEGSRSAVTLTGGAHSGTYPTVARRTCDAPLCEACTARPAQLIALPDATDGAFSPLGMLKHTRWKNERRDLGQKRTSVMPEPDTRDFCPTCVARMTGPKQGSLF